MCVFENRRVDIVLGFVMSCNKQKQLFMCSRKYYFCIYLSFFDKQHNNQLMRA